MSRVWSPAEFLDRLEALMAKLAAPTGVTNPLQSCPARNSL